MLSIIVAFDKNQLIGKDNKMPWHYPEDLKYFKKITWEKKVVMGSHTYQSILDYLNKPLPNRHNIVITSKKDKYPEVECFPSIDLFLRQYQKSSEEIFIIGGKMIYEQFIDIVDRLYITHINKTFEGDTYFPHFDKDDFKLIHIKTEGELSFSIYERKVHNNE